MSDIKKIAEALKDHNISEVARRTGVNRATLTRIRDGKGGNHTPLIIKVLSEYLGV